MRWTKASSENPVKFSIVMPCVSEMQNPAVCRIVPSATGAVVGAGLILSSFLLSTPQRSMRDLSPDPTVIDVAPGIERTQANSLGHR
jgi:hypothetical protein